MKLYLKIGGKQNKGGEGKLKISTTLNENDRN